MKANRHILRLLAVLALAPAAAFCAASSLGESQPLNRLVTPNDDKKNDTFVFRCYNPRDAAVEAKIYDLAGREIGRMTAADTVGFFSYFSWNPNSGGRVPGGVYVYQIRIEKKVFKGTVTVIR